MKQKFEKAVQDVQIIQYEVPTMKVFEIEFKGSILQISGEYIGRRP